MQSSTKNVQLGACRVYFNGDDLGLTQGGVSVAVTTDTHEVNVDQFGKTPINEIIMGRHLAVKVPMAETTVENLVKIMPGATLIESGGAEASGTITITTNPVDGDTINVNGFVVTFKTVVTDAPKQVLIGAAAANTAANLKAFLSASTDPRVGTATYTVAAAVVTVTYENPGVEGNAFTLGAGTAGVKVTLSGATLAGGTNAAQKYVTVTHGIGQDLLSTAKELRLHPVALAADDHSQDFVIPLANTSGALNFDYKLDAERIYNVEFKGYPDPLSGVLYVVGDNT